MIPDTNYWTMKTPEKIPKFFSRVNVVYSEPIFIESDLERNEVSKIIDDCNVSLNELQSEAEKFD